MITLEFVWVFVLGLIIGSFLNVLIYRLNTGRSVGGRSQCLHCGRILRWYELVPVASFLVQRARCRRCRSRLAWQYPLVELATASLFVLVWLAPGALALKIIQLLIWSLLVVIFVYDLRHQIIPDSLVFAFDALALVLALLSGNFWAHWFAGLGLAAFFWLIWLISRGRWMGFGDGKLALGVGWLAGPAAGLSAITFAFWLGALIGLALLAWSRLWVRGKSYTMKSALPFAPFIIVGLWLATFFQLNVFAFF